MKILAAVLLLIFLTTGSAWSQTLLLDPAGEGGFEKGGTILANNWIQKNNQSASGTDGWYVGAVPAASAGANCGYIGPIASSGATWTYSELGNSGGTSIIHLYHDVLIPANQAIIVVSFKWKAMGEGSLPDDKDNLKVFFTPSTVTPSASTAISSAYQIGASYYNLSSSSWNSSGDITVIGTPGTTQKIVFSWYSNTSNIVNPPAAIDDVTINSYPSLPANAAPINFTASAVTGTEMTIGWTDNSTNELGFRVYRSTDNVNFSQVGTDILSSSIAGTGTAYSQLQSGLNPDVTYYYKIAAVYALESSYLTGNQATSASTLFGIRTVGGAGTPDYASISSAIADLNNNGVGLGGVTFNIAAGYTETFSTASAGYITATNGSASRPITFQKSGEGANPVITAPVGTGATDAIIAITGCDYVTFNGIDLIENPANSNATTRMEWGYAILKSTGISVDGSQNITIRNCAITLDKTSQTSIGIYSNNHTIANAAAQLTVTSLSGTNSYFKIFNNTISCFSGINLNGFADLNGETYLDQNNEIGVDGANLITNIGGNSSTTFATGVACQCQNNLKIANNTVTSTMAGNAMSVYGIYCYNGKNASYDIYNNYISIQFSGLGSSNLYPLYCDMGSAGTSNTMNVYNNILTGCAFSTMLNGNVRFINLANLGVTANIFGNKIYNNIIGDGGLASSGQIMYLSCTKSSNIYGPLNIYHNKITNNKRKTNQSTTFPSSFISVNGTCSQLNIYGDTITDNVVWAGNTTTIIGTSGTQGSVKIYDNFVSNISEVNGLAFTGISFVTSSNNVKAEIYRNTIQNIEGFGTSTKMAGIAHQSNGAGSYSYIYNNRIADLRAPYSLASANGGDCLTGININGSNFLSVFNNTVFLNGTSTAATFGTSAFYATSSNSNLELKNNIFVNTSTAKGTGLVSAIRFTSTTWSAGLSQTSNNNLVYAGTPGTSNVLFTDNVANKDQTLADYKNRLYPRETQSVSEMPPFESIVSGSTNVKLKTIVPTQCESGGSVIAGTYPVTTDFENEPRYPNTGHPVGSTTPYAPDMGVDEFGGMPNDLTAPVIVYSPLASTDVTTERTLIVTITDGNGVPITGAGLPKLYWKINSGTYISTPDPVVLGNTYTFTFGGGAVLGNTVSYYVVAQDMAAIPNVTSNPFIGALGFSVNPPACGTAPTTPNSYSIVAPFTGTYHVGVGKDYATLTLAAAAVNSRTLTGPVTLVLDDAVYASETIPVSFNANAGSSSVNTLTLKPNTGVSPVINSTTSATGIIDLNGIDYMVIDGSNNETNSRNLTISNSKVATNNTYALGIKGTASDATTNITIKNCILKSLRLETTNTSNNTSSIRISSAGAGFENIVIDNNSINSAYNGIQLWGYSNGILAKNVQITNNTIGSTIPSEAITGRGIDVLNADNTLIANNEIMGPSDGSANKAQVGIQLGGSVTNTKISKNNIHSFWRPVTSDDSYGCYGIYCNTGASTITEITNNLIYDIHSGGSGPGVATTNTYGVFFASGGNTKILHNTINLSGAFISTSKNASSACIGFMNTVLGGNFEIRNNILRNSMTFMGTTPTNGRAYGIMTYASPAQFSTLNYNDYFIDGTNGTIGQFYGGSTPAIVNYPTLASWQAFTGQDANSVTLDPIFTSATNLLPTTTLMNNAGTYSTLVTTDINGANRSNPPDIGAYEYAPDQIVVTEVADGISGTGANLHGNINAAGFTVNSFFDYGLTTAYGTSVAATPASVTGSTSTTIGADLSGLTPLTTYHFRARGVTTGGVTVYGNDMVFVTTSSNKVLNLKIFLQGLYAGSGLMNQAQGAAGAQFGAGIADQVTVELHETDAPFATAYVYPDINLGTNGNIVVSSIPANVTGSYYVVIKHRNSIETWSGLPIVFGANTSYDFTTAATQAYGSNMKLIGSVYAVFAGDVNQDGVVDAADMVAVDNGASNFVNGYVATNINGDGMVNADDMFILGENAAAFAGKMKP
jgi:hypothetical protein